jgi:hypothetical protein
MGHAKVTTTLTICSHLFPSDHTEHMTALAAMNAPVGPECGADAPSRLISFRRNARAS